MLSADDQLTLASYRRRARALQEYLSELFKPGELYRQMICAVTKDGWPEAMVVEGFRRHRETWRVDILRRGVAQETADYGGISEFFHRARRRVFTLPSSVSHIWPALPGAGVTPILYGALLGISQRIRPSRRGLHFAEFIHRSWPESLPELQLIRPEERAKSWADVAVIVASGSDETIERIDELAAEAARELEQPKAVIVGYGHRISFCVVYDDNSLDLIEIAQKIAEDAVLWHQKGCFSPRAVLFCGDDTRLESFGAALGAAISAQEARLDAQKIGNFELARRAQARGVAEFRAKLWGDGVGWAQLSDEPFRGAQVSAHALSIHRLKSAADLPGALDLPARHIQGVALAAPAEVYKAWSTALLEAGATRVCLPGELQTPPADWPHDGRPNFLEWLG